MSGKLLRPNYVLLLVSQFLITANTAPFIGSPSMDHPAIKAWYVDGENKLRTPPSGGVLKVGKDAMDRLVSPTGLFVFLWLVGTFAQDLDIDTEDGFADFDQPDVGDVDGAYDMSMDFTGVRTPSGSANVVANGQSVQSTTSLPSFRTSTRPPRNIQNTSMTGNYTGNSTRNSTAFPNMTTTIPPRVLYARSFPLRPKAAVILTVGTSTAYDYNILAPALEIAFARAAVDYNVHMQVKNYLYEVDETGSSDSPDATLGKTQGCWMWNASGMSAYAVNDTVDVVIGPACTDDMRIVNELLTYFAIPCVTGAANLVDSTFQYKYLTRAGFSTYDMWTFLVRMMQYYKWSSVCVIYDIDVMELNVEATSLLKNLKENLISTYDIRINGTEFEAFESIPGWLKECGIRSRVVVFVLKGHLTRHFLVEAAHHDMVNGEWVFFTADLFLNDVLGVDGNWKQRDGYDKEALSAYRYLFVLSIRDVRDTLQYKTFQAQVRNRGAIKFNKPKESIVINYYSASFHDSILLFAKGMRMAYESPIRKRAYDGQLPLVVNTVNRFMWNSSFDGASGLVYINPKGDRADDLTMYRMTDEVHGTFSVVAIYYGNEGAYRELRSIPWRTADEKPPLNEPVCGYENNACIEVTSAASIGGGLAALLVLGLLGAWLWYYVQHRNDKNKHHSEWLAEWEDITMDQQSTQSRMSLNSSTSLSKPSLRSDDDGISRRSNKKPPPSSGRLAFGTWQGRLVMISLCEPHVVNLKRLQSEVKIVRGISHDNILHFLGAVVGPDHYAVIGEYCSKGTLQDLLADETAKLDWIFRYSLLSDLVKGIIYIHGSPLTVHGRLTSACCYVDGKFVLKVGDYGLPSMYKRTMPSELTYQNYVSLYWTAPELLDHHNGPGTVEGDVFAFGIILQEIILREEPYSMYELEPEEIIARVRNPEIFFRPSVPNTDGAPGLLSLMDQCFQHDPQERPRFPQVRTSLRQMTRGAVEKSNIVDLLISRMEQYAADLEKSVEEKTRAFQEEKKKTDALLNQILPSSVAERLKKGEMVPPESFESATIFFSDIVGFPAMALESSPTQIVEFLNDLYSLFDGTMPKFDVYKVETIQDSYMVASGLPNRNGLNHAKEQALLALTLMSLIKSFKIKHLDDEAPRLRIGLNTGPVVASVIGLTVPRYCLFGDTVNTASRMESTGLGLKIQISPSTKAILDGFGTFRTKDRGEIEVKGKGLIRTYWLIGRTNQNEDDEDEPPVVTFTVPEN